MREYKCLSKQSYSIYEYQIVPIRNEDKYDIMQWRNEQIYHLRQSKPLDKESQNHYFNNVIARLFEKESPDQILFSYLAPLDLLVDFAKLQLTLGLEKM